MRMEEEVLPYECASKSIPAYCRRVHSVQGCVRYCYVYNYRQGGEKMSGTQEAERDFIKGPENEEQGVVPQAISSIRRKKERPRGYVTTLKPAI